MKESQSPTCKIMHHQFTRVYSENGLLKNISEEKMDYSNLQRRKWYISPEFIQDRDTSVNAMNYILHIRTQKSVLIISTCIESGELQRLKNVTEQWNLAQLQNKSWCFCKITIWTWYFLRSNFQSCDNSRIDLALKPSSNFSTAWSRE